MQPIPRRILLLTALVTAVAVVTACDSGTVPATPRPVAGTPDVPREVNLIAKDYSFLPPVLDLVPGETILLHVINGGLEVHEAVIGAGAVQDAWEVAEGATVGAPPGPTPVVSVPRDVAGLRVVVRSGERADVRWAVPLGVPVDAPVTTPPAAAAWIVGCHIPGHLANGMWIPIRWVVDPAS